MLVLAAAGYFGQKVEQFWEKAGLVLGKKNSSGLVNCQVEFGRCLQWENCGSKEGFK